MVMYFGRFNAPYKPSAEPPHFWLAKSVRGVINKGCSLIDKNCVGNKIDWDEGEC